MELKENFTSNTHSPYDSDRSIQQQNTFNQPYINHATNDGVPPVQTTYQPTYQMNPGYGEQPFNSPNILISQEVVLKQEPRGCLSHLCDGSLEGNARNNFIKKVYMILTMQLALTAGFCFISFYSSRLFEFQLDNYWLMWVCLALMIVTQIPIICCQIGRVFPYNMIILLIFTLAEAYMVSCITSIVAKVSGGAIVIIAACMTLAIVVVLTLYSIFTRSDFTTGWGILFAVIAPFIMLGIFAWIAWIPVLHTLYCALGAAVFGIYLVIDTQLIFGGGRYSLSMDDYVAGALILYIDIVQIFLYILQLLGN